MSYSISDDKYSVLETISLQLTGFELSPDTSEGSVIFS